MPLEFNIPSEARSEYSVNIEQSTYIFRFNWQERSQNWHFDMLTADAEPLVLGAKLVPNVPMIRRNRDLGPEGNIYVVNGSTGESVAGRNNLGMNKDFKLLYFSRQELNIILGAT